MPAVKKSLKRKREIIAKVKRKKKCPSTIGEGNTERGNARRPLSCGGRKKNVQMLEYRRNRLKALRQKRWKKAATNCSNTIIDDSSPMLRSASVQNISGLDENYIVNLQLLREGLRRCNLCGEGPFSLDDISKAPMRIGLGVVLYLKCRNCKEESSIRTYDPHRAGKP